MLFALFLFVLADDLVVSKDLDLVLFKGLSILLDFQASEVVDAIDICDHFKIMALYFNFLDFFIPGLILDLNEISPVIGLFDSGLYVLGFIDQLYFYLF